MQNMFGVARTNVESAHREGRTEKKTALNSEKWINAQIQRTSRMP
jgi:hypothetical protein